MATHRPAAHRWKLVPSQFHMPSVQAPLGAPAEPGLPPEDALLPPLGELPLPEGEDEPPLPEGDEEPEPELDAPPP